MLSGKIYKVLAGTYYIMTDVGKVEAKAKGSFRNDNTVPKVGDNVLLEQQAGSYRIKNVCPRKNELTRPPVANIDKLVIVMAVRKPEPDFVLAEKLIFSCRMNCIEPIIVINKSDIDNESAAKLASEMVQSGAKTICVSAKNNVGINDLMNELKGYTSSFAGQSAVGKSSIATHLLSGLTLNIGGLSKKTDRGKHTTRCCELYCFDNDSFIVDTPGFSLFDEELISPEDFVRNFDDAYCELSKKCRFRGCSHTNEPDCAVMDAVQNGELSEQRYSRYCKLYKIILEKWRNRYD